MLKSAERLLVLLILSTFAFAGYRSTGVEKATPIPIEDGMFTVGTRVYIDGGWIQVPAGTQWIGCPNYNTDSPRIMLSGGPADPHDCFLIFRDSFDGVTIDEHN